MRCCSASRTSSSEEAVLGCAEAAGSTTEGWRVNRGPAEIRRGYGVGKHKTNIIYAGLLNKRDQKVPGNNVSNLHSSVVSALLTPLRTPLFTTSIMLYTRTGPQYWPLTAS